MNPNSSRFSFINLMQLISDIITIPVCIILAYGLKFKVGWFFQKLFSINVGTIYQHTQIESYYPVMGVIVLIWVITFYFTGIYKPRVGIMADVDLIIKIIKAGIIATIEVMAITFIYKSFPGSRYVIFYTWLFAIFFISINHILISKIELYLAKKGIGCLKIVIIGDDDISQDVAEKTIVFEGLKMQYKGTFSDNIPQKIHFHLKNKYKYLGKPNSIFTWIKENKINIIFVTTHTLSDKFYQKLVLACEKSGIELRIISEKAKVFGSNMNLIDFDGLPFFTQPIQSYKYISLFLKRLFDIIFALFIAIIFLPIIILTSLLIKIVSQNGPIFYFQERITLNGKIFKMYKFRTMIPNAESKTGPIMVDEKNETRYIPIGKFLRKTSIDEIPQLFNVIKGDMSIVGPRPERPFFVDKFSKELPYYPRRHQMKAGITGWAQINGRSILTKRPEHKIKYDLYYIKNWSLIFDIKILLKTFSVVISKDEAY